MLELECQQRQSLVLTNLKNNLIRAFFRTEERPSEDERREERMEKLLKKRKKLVGLRFLENMRNFKTFFDRIQWLLQQGEDQGLLKEKILDLGDDNHLILGMNEVLDLEDLMKLEDQEADLGQGMIDLEDEMTMVDHLQEDMTELDKDTIDQELGMIDQHLGMTDLLLVTTDLLRVMIDQLLAMIEEVMIDLQWIDQEAMIDMIELPMIDQARDMIAQVKDTIDSMIEAETTETNTADQGMTLEETQEDLSIDHQTTMTEEEAMIDPQLVKEATVQVDHQMDMTDSSIEEMTSEDHIRMEATEEDIK